MHLTASRRALIAGCVIACTATMCPTASPVLAYGADVGLLQTPDGAVALSCATPNPQGIEVSPTVSSEGVIVPPETVPGVSVPPVTVGPAQVGPVTVGPYTVGGFTTQPTPVGGETVGAASQSDAVALAGAVSCVAMNVSAPTIRPGLTGSVRIVLFLEELDSSSGSTGFYPWSEVDGILIARFVDTWNVDAPPPQPLPVAVGVLTDTESGVPGLGQVDPHTGHVSLGIGQVYFGVPMAIDWIAEPTGVACETGDFTCSTSATFPVY